VALGIAGAAPTPLLAQATAPSDGPDWPGVLKGRHRQVVDAYEVNSGFPLAFVYTFMLPNDRSNTTAVLVLRHGAFPIALGHEMWKKYKIGEAFKIIDPETKAPAVKNAEAQCAAPGRDGDRPSARQRHRGRGLQRCPDRPEPDARQQCRRGRPRGGHGMGGQRDPGDHRHPVGNLGREPCPGKRLQLLRRRLSGRRMTARHAASWDAAPGAFARGLFCGFFAADGDAWLGATLREGWYRRRVSVL
jgi:hypothetical protein